MCYFVLQTESVTIYALPWVADRNCYVVSVQPQVYADPKQEAVFRDYTKAPYPTIPENDTFLYNGPHQLGAKVG